MPTSRASLLSSSVRRSITDRIAAEPDRWTAPDLAEELGLHVTTVRFHLDQLEQAGVLQSQPERRDRPGRPRKVYRAAEDATPVNTAAYVILADVLAATLEHPVEGADRADAADRAGAAWVASHLEAEPEAADDGLPVRPLLDVLASWGYPHESVTVEDDPRGHCQVSLTHCPMLDAARRHPDVVCGIHLGLVRGALDRLGVDDAAVRVTPMVSHSLCTVDLGTPGHGEVEDGLDLSHVQGRAGETD